MTPELTDLIARLEKATGPDRELDARILVALDIRPGWLQKSKGEMWVDTKSPVGPVVRFKDECIAKRGAGNPPTGDFAHYTASLDAAMMLVPEGWTASVLALPNTSQRVNGARGVVTLYEGAALSQTRCLMPEIEATTPALALCIAALKALAASEAP